MSRLDEMEAQCAIMVDRILQPVLAKLDEQRLLYISGGSSERVPASTYGMDHGENQDIISSMTTEVSLRGSRRQDASSAGSSAQGFRERHELSISSPAGPSGANKKLSDLKWPECYENCICKCHSRKFYAFPKRASTFGSWHLGYTGPTLIEFLSRKCSQRDCQRQSSPFLELIYQFPLWFARLTLRATAGMPLSGGPTFGLVLRKRNDDSKSFGEFTRALSGDKGGLCSLLIDRKIHPNDVTRIRGMTLLQVSPCILHPIHSRTD